MSWQPILRALGQRPPFSQAERQALQALYDHWLARNRQPRWQPLAVCAPRYPATLFYCVCSFLVTALGWFQPWWSVALGVVLLLAMSSEWSGLFRLSQLFFAPRGSGFLSLSGGNRASSYTIVLCAGIDTPSADLSYHSEPFTRWLRPLHWQSITPAAILLGLTGCSVVFVLLLFAYPRPLVYILFFVFLALQGAFGSLLWWTSITPLNEETSIHAITAACHTVEKLEALGDTFPCRWELLLLGASTHGWAMESWIRQHQHLYHPAHTFFLEIAPSSARANALYYRTQEGVLRRVFMNERWITAAESIAQRFQKQHKLTVVPAPQRRFGCSLSWVAHQHGYPAMVLGADLHPTVSAVTSTCTPENEERLSAWCMAVATALSSSLGADLAM